ncbi:MAG: hypothetical protein PUC40_07505 [Lachnospiraceae bacterium]|nr:hypothetical protein [Lachnospiraceae bacterium]MDD6380899.1 hypothetical protein [Lachnospiraceae bacterium]
MKETKTKKIDEVLRVGKENAIDWQTLAAMIGVKDRRTLYKTIETERKAGVLILSDGKGGYYIPDIKNDKDIAEIEHFIKKFSAMAKNIFGDLKGARQALKAAEAEQALKSMEQAIKNITQETESL